MGIILDDKLTMNKNGEFCNIIGSSTYEGTYCPYLEKIEKTGKWGGKTLYYYDSVSHTLHYEYFSFIRLIFHAFGYKKKFNDSDLTHFLIAKNIIKLQPNAVEKIDATTRQAFKTFFAKKAQLELLFFSLPRNQEAIIRLFEEGLDINTEIDGDLCFKKFSDSQCWNLVQYLLNKIPSLDITSSLNNSFKLKLFSSYLDSFKNILKVLNTKNKKLIPLEKIQILDIIQTMLLKGIKLNTNDYSPYISTSFSASCLTIACNTDNLAVVQSLLEKGADANDLQALKNAVFHTNIKIVNFLFEKCPEINSEVESELFFDSLLRIAVKRFRNLDMIKVLIDKGCDINQKEGLQDDTHLHIAASHGDIETVKFLILLGASSSIKNKNEETAADIARSNKYEDVAQYLENLKF